MIRRSRAVAALTMRMLRIAYLVPLVLKSTQLLFSWQQRKLRDSKLKTEVLSIKKIRNYSDFNAPLLINQTPNQARRSSCRFR
jgi:hypothetical protein